MICQLAAALCLSTFVPTHAQLPKWNTFSNY